VTPTYNGNGELTYDGTFTYGYDAEGRLISASGAGNAASYAYDAQGRRKSKTVNGTTTLFVQDPQSRALLDYNGAGGAVLDWYAFGLGPNDVLNQIGAATRATYARHPGLDRRLARRRLGRADQGRLPALRREPIDRRDVPLHRRAHRRGDQWALRLSRPDVLADTWPLHVPRVAPHVLSR
jgi:YD repeat-containing protein